MSEQTVVKHGNTGRTHSKKTKKKMSQAKKGKPISEETRKKMSEAHKGNKHSEETRKKIGEGNRGKTISKETRRKTSEIHTGYKHSEEAKRKISEAKRGEKHPQYGKPPSAETKKKLSKANTGKKNHNYGKTHSEETRRKMSEALKGKPLSEEHKRKISEAKKGKKNPCWKGGYEPYYGDNWSWQNKTCLIRDDNTCQLCGKKREEGFKIDVHHIIPFRNFVRKARKPDYNKANDLKNLVCLCSICHGKADSKQSYMRFKEPLLQVSSKNTKQFL